MFRVAIIAAGELYPGLEDVAIAVTADHPDGDVL